MENTMIYNLVMFFGLSLVVLMLEGERLFKPLIIFGLFSIFFPGALSPVAGNSSLFAMGNASAQSLLFTVIVLSVPSRSFKFFPIICLLNSLIMIFNPQHYALGMATSMDSVLIAIMYPIYLRWLSDLFPNIYENLRGNALRFSLLLIPIIAIFISGGSVGIGGLCLGLFILYSRPRFYKYLLVPIALFTLYFLRDPNLFNSSLRFEAWQWTIQWWSQLPLENLLFGTGLGTFSILGPYIQITTNHMPTVLFTELHNDWLQVLFELGYIGLSLSILLFLYFIYRARHDRHLLASIVTFGACALFYYPTKNVVTAAYGVLLFKVILDLDNYSSNNLGIKPKHGYDDFV